MRIITFVLIVAMLCPVCFFSGCKAKAKLYGQKIAGNNITRIGDILANPVQFTGKMVKISGKITEECPSGCWFRVKDDSGIIFVNIHPSNFVIPQVRGQQIVVEGSIKKEGTNISLIGTGVEMQ